MTQKESIASPKDEIAPEVYLTAVTYLENLISQCVAESRKKNEKKMALRQY